MSRTCSKCPSEIGRQNRSGLCRQCSLARLQSDPAIAAKRSQAMRQALRQPEVRAKIAASNKQRFIDDPTLRAVHAAKASAVYHLTIGSEKARKAANSPETRAKIGKSVSKARLRKAGVPIEYREEYLRLIHNIRGIDAAEAARIVRAKAEAESLKALATYDNLLSAQDYLRRFAAVIRDGDCWRYGTATLTGEELIARALLRGWTAPETMRRAA